MTVGLMRDPSRWTGSVCPERPTGTITDTSTKTVARPRPAAIT